MAAIDSANTLRGLPPSRKTLVIDQQAVSSQNWSDIVSWITTPPTNPLDMSVCACSMDTGGGSPAYTDLEELRRVSPSQIKQLKKAGVDPEELKRDFGQANGKNDLFRDPKTGDIYVGPKDGNGFGEPAFVRLEPNGTVVEGPPVVDPVPVDPEPVEPIVPLE